MRTWSVIIIGMLTGLSCVKDPYQSPSPKPKLVISGLIYAHRSVEKIQISRTVATESIDSSNTAFVSNAKVELVCNNNRYVLSESDPDNGYYHYTGSDLFIRPGDALKIWVSSDDLTAFSQTIVPQAQMRQMPDTVVWNLNNTSLDTYLRYNTARLSPDHGLSVQITCLEPIPIPLQAGIINSSEITFKSSGGSLAVPLWVLNQGRHRAIVSLFSNNIPLSGNFSTLWQSTDCFPINIETNVEGGLGYFTAVDQDTSYFYIQRKG